MNFIYPEKIKLFTLKEFSRACDVSRATLLRLEADGILTPCKVDPQTGYRYYDALNVTEFGQYNLMQDFSLSRAEIAGYLSDSSVSRAFLDKQRERVSRMQRILDEIELILNRSSGFRFSYLDLPETVCYCTKKKLSSIEEGAQFFFTAIEQCVMAGYKIKTEEHIFGLRSDDFKNGAHETDAEFTACIPVKTSDPDCPDLTVFPSVHVFSAIAYGNYSVINELCTRFWEEIEKRGLKPNGPGRFIDIVTPHIGRNISPDDFCYRLVIPIEPADVLPPG